MEHTRNLTRGSIPRELTELMLPLLLGNILQQTYNAADAWIIGRWVGREAFAAIGVAGTVMNLLIFVLSGACTGVSVLFSQFYGAEDLPAFRREGHLALRWGTAASAALGLAVLPLLSPLLAAIRTPAEVAPYCRAYLVIVACGLPATYLYNLFAAMLRSVGNTAAALGSLLAAMAANVALDLLLTARLGWGVRGAAAATVLSQAMAAGLCWAYFRRALPELLPGREDRQADRDLVGRTVAYGLSAAFHQSSLYIGKLLVQGAVNGMGTELTAAYTAASRIEGFANSFGDSGAAAVSVFIGQNTGVGDGGRARRGLWTAFALMVPLSLALAAALYVPALPAVAWLSGEGGTVASEGAAYLRTIAAFYVLNYIGSVFVGWFRGRGQVNVPAAGTALHITLRVVLSYLLIRTMGLRAVALATGLGWALVVSFQIVVFRVTEKREGA
ncbi:MATE family efflux transporter [Dysosmobacter sp.]|uniref:MATE family efflux transporter n=1 Tax=Dysosmobacter sp. TaxID=2591382 RepID=UPI002A88D547|nr:MATE family efflux transporter [Dysosmobacter sp.]MDY3282216.1 MATE family efflux transporter [Dysosmobacter sp.]